MLSLIKTLEIASVCINTTITDETLLARNSPNPLFTSKISNVLCRLGYLRKEQQYNYIKLLGISDALPETLSIENPRDRLLTDEEAGSIIQELNFENEDKAFEWLVTTTQKKWIRKTHAQEGPGGTSDAKLARWFVEDSGFFLENAQQLHNIIDNLGFHSGTTWQEDSQPDEILLMGGLEDQIVERLDALQQIENTIKSEIPINYLTGNRGVFNFEKSLASILAEEWFHDANLKESIQQVLNENKKDWKEMVEHHNFSF